MNELITLYSINFGLLLGFSIGLAIGLNSTEPILKTTIAIEAIKDRTHQYRVWTDLTEAQLLSVDGVGGISLNFHQLDGSYIVNLNPRYDESKTLNRIRERANGTLVIVGSKSIGKRVRDFLQRTFSRTPI